MFHQDLVLRHHFVLRRGAHPINSTGGFLCAGKNLRHVNRLHSRILPVQRPAQVHQAAIVQSRAELCARRQHIIELHRQHRRRNVGVLHAERAAKSAATIQILERHEVQPPHLLQQPERPIAQLQRPEPMAARMVGHAMGKVRAHILRAQLVDEKLAQFVDSRQQCGEFLAEGLVSKLLKQPGILIADHCHAGR